MAKMPKDKFDNQQNDPDIQDRDEDQSAQKDQQAEIDQALRDRNLGRRGEEGPSDRRDD